MESKRQVGPSSSLSADIFGANESPSSMAAGTFASIFPPPQTVVGRNSELTGSGRVKQSPGNQVWNNKQEPSHFSSSLYYGGQEDYSHSPGTQNPGLYPTLFKKDGERDDPNGANSHGASRGNWWQGSLYY